MTNSNWPSTKTHPGQPVNKKIGHRIKAVLFDFDGTLTQPGALDFAAIKRAIGCPPDMAILEYIDTANSPTEKERLIRILDESEEAAAHLSKPNRGAEAILDWLKSKDIQLGIITRNALTPVIRSLENFSRFSLEDFDVVISREDPIQPKPSPDGVRMALERLKIDSSEAVMIGDYLFDMAAGNSAGVATILLPAIDEQRDVNDWGQDYQIKNLAELQTMIEYYLPLSSGKLPNRFLNEFLTTLKIPDPSVLIAPGVGEDTTAVDIIDEEVLVLKSDPITFVSDAAARYAVTINANDIATSGAVPRWFLSTLLFPPGSTPSEILAVMTELQDFCDQQKITLCGGHTEITDAVNRPVISGMIAGTVSKNRLVDKKNMKTGDRVLLTKAVSIEGTSILAQEFDQQLLQGGLTPDDIDTGKQLLEQIGIVQEAVIASNCEGVTAMHDVTEGGLATALQELSLAGSHSISIDMDRIPIHDLTRRMCAIFDLDPLGLIGSGSLLICCNDTDLDSLISGIEAEGIHVTQIGEVLAPGSEIQAKLHGKEIDWPVFETDELTRLYG